MTKVAILMLSGALTFGVALAPVDAAFAKKKSPTEAAKTVKKGPTDISECGKWEAAQRDECISRSSPVRGSSLSAKKAAAAPASVKKAADAPVPAKKASTAAEKSPAKASVSGPTDLSSCGKLDASKRDACISNSRPVSGADKK